MATRTIKTMAIEIRLQNPGFCWEACYRLAREQAQAESLERWLTSLSLVEIESIKKTIAHSDMRIGRPRLEDLEVEFKALIRYNQRQTKVWQGLTTEYAWTKAYLDQAEILRGIFPNKLQYVSMPAL